MLPKQRPSRVGDVARGKTILFQQLVVRARLTIDVHEAMAKHQRGTILAENLGDCKQQEDGNRQKRATRLTEI